MQRLCDGPGAGWLKTLPEFTMGEFLAAAMQDALWEVFSSAGRVPRAHAGARRFVRASGCAHSHAAAADSAERRAERGQVLARAEPGVVRARPPCG